jgi:hypothetical protein
MKPLQAAVTTTTTMENAAAMLEKQANFTMDFVPKAAPTVWGTLLSNLQSR